MNVDSAVEMAWGSPTVAFHFLVWTGLIKLPKFCPAGHPWTPSASDKYTCLHCRHSRPRTAAEVRMDAHEEREERRRRCNKKASWRAPGSFASLLPTSVTVVKLVKLLCYFITCAPLEEVKQQSRCPHRVVRGGGILHNPLPHVCMVAQRRHCRQPARRAWESCVCGRGVHNPPEA